MTAIKNAIMQDKAHYALLTAIIISAILVRVFNIAFEYYYQLDELIISFTANGNSLADVWDRALDEPHPAMNYLLHYLWMKLGDGISWSRYFYIIFGVLFVSTSYLVGREACGKRVGLICAFIAAFSQFTVLYSLFIRNYIMLMFFASLQLYCYLRYSRAEFQNQGLAPKKQRYILLPAYSLFGVLGGLTHFSAFIQVLILSIHHVLNIIKQRKLKVVLLWTIANLPILAAFVFLYMSYMAPGKSLDVWTQSPLIKQVRQYTISQSSGIIDAFFMHLLGWVTVASQYFLHLLQILALQPYISAVMFYLFCFGCIHLYSNNRNIFYLVSIAIAVQLLLTVTGVYMASFGCRYYAYLYLELIIPVSVAVSNIIDKIKLKAPARFALTLALLMVLTICVINSRFYYFLGEFFLTRKTADEAAEYLAKNIKGNDIIITDLSTILFYKYRDGNSTEGIPYTDFGEYRINSVSAYYSALFSLGSVYTYPHQMANIINKVIDNKGKEYEKAETVWLIKSAYESVIDSLANCSALHGKFSKYYNKEWFVALAFTREEFQRSIVESPEIVQFCYDNFRPEKFWLRKD